MSFHLSDFADFINIVIRYRSKQRTSELALMATKWFPPVLFSRKEILAERKSQ